jgi:adenine-specific DNA-methyltransferase
MRNAISLHGLTKKSVLLANASIEKTLPPCREESMNFDSTENLYIESDNLDVLKFLQETYLNKVKMIYIDSPYNTGNDFVYEDDFAQSTNEYLESSGQFDEIGNRLVKNLDSNGRFHTNWLNMIYPRLKLAKDLLRDDGIIFISIDDNEVQNLWKLCDEIYGEENFIGCFVWKRRTPSAMDRTKASTDHEYVLAYHRGVFSALRGVDKDFQGYSNPDCDPRGLWTTGDLTVGMNGDMRPNQFYNLIDPKTGKVYKPNLNRVWSYAPESMQKLIEEGRVIFPEDINKRPMRKRFANELNSDINPFSTWLTEVGMNAEGTRIANSLFDNKALFNYTKPLSLIKSLIQQATANSDIILGFFSGSTTTAHLSLCFANAVALSCSKTCR